MTILGKSLFDDVSSFIDHGNSAELHRALKIDGGRGTVTLNGTTPVTVADAEITDKSIVLFTLKTVHGTVGAYPVVATITPGTGFTVKGTALDISDYNYLVIG